MSAATILFTDIVGFSKKPTAEQRRLVEALTTEVVYELRPLLTPPTGTPSIVALPTGDGIALAFLHGPRQPWDRAKIFRLIRRLQEWAGHETGVNLRIGVHAGPVELVTDINGRPNVCGDTINYAQRVMDAANPMQVLFSDTAIREYVGTETNVCTTEPFPEGLRAEFHGPIEVFAKHGLQILVHKMILHPSQTWWSNEDPVAKQWMLVTLTELPKEILGPFNERLQQAKSVALVQLTGHRLLASLEEGKTKLSDALKRFWVLMPDPVTYAHLNLSPYYATPQFVGECIEKWRVLLAAIKKQSPKADLKLGLFKEPPYFGASFTDWERPDGVIHVSPYVWSVPAPECPGYDLRWLGKRPSPVYEVYVRGLEYLHGQTANVAFES
jgi:class 3 adenylate cyclase